MSTIDAVDRSGHHDADGELGIRPFNARSLVLSMLLGLPEPRLAVASILGLANQFGIAPGTMRTALSRMVAAGELAHQSGDYELRGRLLERKQAQDVGRRPPGNPWDGTWWIAAVTAPSRTVADRREFRAHMANARMGELRPETWLRPANLAGPRVGRDVALLRGPLSGSPPDELVGVLWNLPDIEARCRTLLAALDPPDDDLPALMHRAAAVVRFLREEPLLPRSLTPVTWPVDELRDRYRELDRRIGQALRAVARPA